jgi:hypothetical protein
VDGILFFHIHGTYQPGTSPNVLWLPPQDIEKVLGWKPPENVLPKPKQKGYEGFVTASAITTAASATTTTSAGADGAQAGPSGTATTVAAS